MAKQDLLELEGIVTNRIHDSYFVDAEVEGKEGEEPNKFTVICHLGGKIRKNHITVLEGDKVKIMVSPYDLTKGTIIFRYR